MHSTYPTKCAYVEPKVVECEPLAMGATDGTGKPANPNPVISLAGSRVVQLARYTDYVVCSPGPAAAAAAATSAAKLGLLAPLLGRIAWIIGRFRYIAARAER